MAGFNVRKGTSLLDKNRVLVGKYFLCSKEGLKKDRKLKGLDGMVEKGKEQKKRLKATFERCARLCLV